MENKIRIRGQGQDNTSIQKITIGDTRLWRQREAEFPYTSPDNPTDEPTFDIYIRPDIEEIDRYENWTLWHHTSLYPIKESSELYNHHETIIKNVR